MVKYGLLLLVLGGCVGTEASFEGQVCGQPVKFELNDKKDRSGFAATVTCPGGGGITVTTTDSSTSAVIQSMAQLAAQMAETVKELATKAAVASATGT